MQVIKSTHRHKLSYMFPYIVEFDHTPVGLAEFLKYNEHFEARYGPSSEFRMLDGRNMSTLCYNKNWRGERNSTRKRLRIYIKEPKDLTWAQLVLA